VIKTDVRQAGYFVAEPEGTVRSIKIVCVFSPTSDKEETA